jgi:hypothetical protein
MYILFYVTRCFLLPLHGITRGVENLDTYDYFGKTELLAHLA